jgi:hypothetical protein
VGGDGGGGTLLKGGGGGESGDTWRVELGRERGTSAAENGSGGQHRPLAAGTGGGVATRQWRAAGRG